MTTHTKTIAATAAALAATLLTSTACTSNQDTTTTPNQTTQAVTNSTPPDRIQQWMNSLTVPHHYDPATGFIVADRTTPLPTIFLTGTDAENALNNQPTPLIIAVATADRCAPCQQYKLDALNNPDVITALTNNPDITALHIEVDQQPTTADTHFNSRAIPMTYAIRDGQIIATLRGQRPAQDLLTFITNNTP